MSSSTGRIAARASRRVVRFGVFEFDPATGELRKHGLRIKLRGQPNEVLAVLLEHPGEVVTREELQKRLWPEDTFVDFEHSLNAAIKRLRAALGDSADAPRFVETLARRGYRFIAPVAEPSSEEVRVAPAAPEPPRPRTLHRPWLAITAAAGVVLLTAVLLLAPVVRRGSPAVSAVSIRSLAVLPLADVSPGRDQDELADEITDSLRRRLAEIRPLRVISRTSSTENLGTGRTVPEIARALNVDAIATGTLERLGDRVRISLEVAEAAAGRRIWTGTYEGEIKDIPTLQESAAVAIADGIRATPEPLHGIPTAHTRPYNPEAYRAYARGRFLWSKRTEANMQAAIRSFQQAVKADPEYALAWDGLADCWVALGWYGYVAPADAYPPAREAVSRALSLDDSLAEAHTTLAFISVYYDRNWTGAEREFRRAIDLNPNYANGHHWYAEFLSLVGRHEEAIAEAERARELDPLSTIINLWVGSRYFFARKYDRAIDLYRGAIEMDPNFAPAHLVLGNAYEQTGKLGQAVAELETGVRLSDGGAVYLSSLAHACTLAGRRERANELRRELERLSKQTFVSSYDLAVASLGIAAVEETFRLLDQAVEERSPRVAFIGIGPRFDSLRSDRRFQALKERLGLR